MGFVGRLCAMFGITQHRPLRWIPPPVDWRDVEAWNNYWRARIEGGTHRFHIRDSCAVLMACEVSRLRGVGRRRILIVGGGISLEPRMFAHAGFEVVALDVSEVATTCARDYTPSAEDWRFLFQLIAMMRARSRREGGSVTYISGDMFDHAVAPGPFDAIFSTRSLQGFTDDDLVLAVAALDARLAPTGECRVIVQNSAERYERIRGEFLRLGFSVGRWEQLAIVVASG